MDWTVSPLQAANLQARNFQVQGTYQSQQPAPGFSQANTSIENSSVYTGNDQAIKLHSSTVSMEANQLPSPNNVGSNNFQPPLLKTSVPVTGFGTSQHFVGLHPPLQLSNMTVQMTSGMANNTWPNSNVHIFSPVAPQLSAGNTVQRPTNLYMASGMYNNHPQKNRSNSVRASVFQGNIKRLPKYRPSDPQAHPAVPPNQIPSHFLNFQHNSSCLTFPSGQNIQNQINDTSSGSTTAMQSQQYASNYVYPPYSLPIHHVAQVIPQATNTNLPPPPAPYAVPPIQINRKEFVLPQPVPNTSNENIQNPQNLQLDQRNGSYSVPHVQTLESIPISRETKEAGGAADSVHGHSAENQPSDELTKSAVEALKNLCNSLQIHGTVPLDKTSAPQTTSIMAEDNTSKSSGNDLDSLIKSKPITRESLELDMKQMFAIKKRLLDLQTKFKVKHKLYLLAAQKSKTSGPSVHNPDLPPPSSNASQQPAPLPQATHHTFSLPSHDTTQKLASLLPHDNTQNQPPSLLAGSSSQNKDSSSLPPRTKSYLYPILQDLLKGTCDEEMMLNAPVARTERNQSKQLVIREKCSSGSVLDSSGAKSETSVNDMEKASRVSPKTSQTLSTEGSLSSMDVNLGFEQTSGLGKNQLTNMSAVSRESLFNYRDKMRAAIAKILTNPESTTFVQKPTMSSESSQLTEKLAKEGSENLWNFRSEFIQQSKDHCLQTPDKSVAAWNNGNNSSSSLAAAVPEAGIVQRSSVTGNSCTVGRACSLEELETSLALWRRSPSASLNDQLGESTKSTMNSSLLNGVVMGTMKNFQNALTDYEKASVAVRKNEPSPSSVPSSLGQKLDAISSSLLKSSEPQVAIVSPLILSKEGLQNEAQEKNLSSMLERIHPVIAEGSVHSLYEFLLTVSDTDKPGKRTTCSPLDSCVTVKEVHSDMHQKRTSSPEENGIQRTETGTDFSCDPNQGLTGPLELEKNIPPLYSRDRFPPGTDDSSSPVSQKCAPKSSPDLVESEDSVLNKNVLQISSVCTLVQGDAFYNSQIASIFNTSSSTSKAENNTSSVDQMPDSHNKEQQLSHWKKDSEISGSTPVEDILSPSLGSLSKAIAEKLLNLPGVKIPHGGKVSEEVNVRDSEEEKNTELCNPNSEKDPEQNISCSVVHSEDLASGNQEVPGNSLVDEGRTHSIQEYVSSDENRAHSVNNIDIALTFSNDQLTELLKEFPYGIDSKVLKTTENEDSAAKLIEIKEGRDTQTCGQNSDANHALDQIQITILDPQQMKKIFPESSSQSSNKLENRENDKVSITSKGTNKSRTQTVLVERANTSAETVRKPAGQSYCCLWGWLGIDYAVDPCKCMLDKEAALKQELDPFLPSEIIIKEKPDNNETNTDCQLNNQQQTIDPVGNNLRYKGLSSLPSLEKSESLQPKNKEQGIEELQGKVRIDELCNQKCTSVFFKSQEQLYSGRDDSEGDSVRSACNGELSGNERAAKETVVVKSKSDTIRHRSMENKFSKKNEKYKIKRDSSETHIIRGPAHTLKRRLKKYAASEGKWKHSERPCSTAATSSNLSNVDLVSKTYSNLQHSEEHLSRQECTTEQDLEINKAVRTEHNESTRSEPVQKNKESLVRTNLKKFAYPEERGHKWQYRRLLSDSMKTSKLQTFRGQHLNMYKIHSSGKEMVWGAHKRDKSFQKNLSDKKSPCNRKNNTLTLQREQKKNYLNKVAFRQTERSICLTKLEQSPSRSFWHVKSSSSSVHPEDKKNYPPCSQQSEVMKPQMLEFKMCPETVFRNLVSEEVPDAKKLPEKATTPVAAVKSTREDWLNFVPLKKRKTIECETQVDDQIPLDTAIGLLDKDEAIKKSNATFETYKKMHLEKRSRSLDSSPLN